MSGKKSNEKTEKWKVKEKVPGTSYVMMDGRFVEATQSEDNGKSGNRTKRKSKKLLDKAMDFFVRIWDAKFKSYVFSNVLVLCITLLITIIYASTCPFEDDKMKRMVMITDTMIPGALTYFVSVIVQNITEITRLERDKMRLSGTIFLIACTVICAVAGVAFKFAQTGDLAIITSFSVVIGYLLSILSLMQIQDSKNKAKKPTE